MLFDRKHKTPGAEDGGEVKRRRDRMAGMWAAELLGLIGKAAHDYAHEVAHAHEHTEDDEHVVGRLAKDLHGKATVHEIREKLAHFVAEARRQLLHESKRDKPGE
ncbi:MAG: ATPase inhibitor subunit zeta [Pseudomonadota bacterium]